MNEVPTRNSGRAWAWGIIVACAVFICMMLAFVFFAFSQQVDLVSRDYYQQEIEHQRQIDRVERTGDLPEDVAWDLRQVDDQLVCEFPLDRIEGEVAGTLHFYRPSDARLDRKWKIDLDEQGHIEISNQSAPKKWIAKEADYSFDQPTGAVTT